MSDYLSIILTILSIIIPVFATIYTGYIRIRNENKEGHKPYLVLGEIEKINEVNRFMYFLAVMGDKLKKVSPEEAEELSKLDSTIKISLSLQNIGYGVASNIKFYDLESAKQIIGLQESSKTMNQKKFTTFDISKDDEKKVQSCLINGRNEDNVNPEDYCILCIYQDLNENIYDFIIGIDVKAGGAYDFYAFQRSSHSYNKLLKNYKKNYKKILNDYKK